MYLGNCCVCMLAYGCSDFLAVAAFKVIAPNKNKAQERLAKLKRKQQ